MTRETLNYMLTSAEGGELLNGEEKQMLRLVHHRLENTEWDDERPRAERLKDFQNDLREIVTPALDRLVNSVTEATEGALIVARMGYGEVSDLEKQAAESAKELVATLAAIRTGRTLDPDTIADGEFLITE